MQLLLSQLSRIALKCTAGKQRTLVTVLAAVWLCGGAARAQRLLDPNAVPGLNAAGRALYSQWLLSNTPRVVAVGENGRIGWYSGGSLQGARSRAVALCTAHGGTACQPYGENLDIVWPGREERAALPPGPLISSINYAFVPDERFFWHGPAAALGVVVWSHGKGGPDVDARGVEPPPFLRAFNNAGFDVVRFDRAPRVDTVLRAAGWLREGLLALRRSGYRRVVAAGQSRGAWTSLQMLDSPGLADDVIALSPAAHGSGGNSDLLAQDDDLRALVADAGRSATRVAFAQFADDPFMSDAAIRAGLMQRLRPQTGGLLIIDQPAGFSGHFAGTSQAFSVRYASCLLRFVLDAMPASACVGPEGKEQGQAEAE